MSVVVERLRIERPWTLVGLVGELNICLRTVVGFSGMMHDWLIYSLQ